MKIYHIHSNNLLDQASHSSTSIKQPTFKMAAEIPEETMEDIKEAFEIYSKTVDLQIEYEQVGSILRALGFNPSNEEVMTALGNPSKEDFAAKSLKLEEFLPVYSAILKDSVAGTFDDLVEGLRVFDKEGNNTVMGAEIRHVLRTLGEKMPPAEINEVMNGKEDLNGLINIEPFVKYLLGEEPKE